MPAGGADLANQFKYGASIYPQQVTSTATGSSVDMQDCGPEVTAVEVIGVNPGDDTTIDTKLQESHDDSTFADITGATFTQVTGDTENQATGKTFYNRSRRYVRAYVTIGGSSPTPMICVIIAARKVSY